MKSTISFLKILTGTSCVLALAACDSIKDVKDPPSANRPADTVVLSGTITGLSSLRAITLMNNGDTVNARSFINGAPTIPNGGVRPLPFSFGSLPVGSSYNITIKSQPELKDCMVTNGQGTLAAGVQTNIVVACSNPPSKPRYDLTVYLPTDPNMFSGRPGARVRLTTEEEIREVAVTSGQASVTFSGAIIDAFGVQNPATWSVTASSLENGVLNKCVVLRPNGTNAGHSAGSPPTTPATPAGNITDPAKAPLVGTAINTTEPACTFSIGGKVGYSQPAGAAYTPTAIAGLQLQLRDLQGNPIESLDVPTCTPTTAAVTTVNVLNPAGTGTAATVPVPTNGCDYKFTKRLGSNTTSGLYEVGVSKQPTGQQCVVVNAGSANLFTTGLNPPTSISSMHVFCRATPVTASQLHGVFRLQSTTWTPNINSPVPVTSTWKPFDLTVQNTASSNMMGFFKNGTFLYGTHANGAQVEQGFYDYNPTANTLRFTLIVDTNTSTTFPATFSPNNTVPAVGNTTIANTQTTTPGISAAPNPIRQDGTSHYAMTGVALGSAESGLGTVRTISGTFGGDPAGAPFPVPTPPATGTRDNRLAWVLQEPPQVAGEMTGAWLAQDGRRLWVWDYRTYYGTGVGVLGGSPSMNDACFTMEDLHAHAGIYTRRGTGTGCYPFARPSNAQVAALAAVPFGSPGVAAAYSSGGSESTDFPAAVGSSYAIPTLPGYTGRIPGGEGAPSTVSPSPVYFQVAPAATFFSVADPIYFPEHFPTANDAATSMAWCTTEILGLRATSNGFPINTPIYLCRTKSN